MEEEEKRVVSPSTEVGLAEEGMVGQDILLPFEIEPPIVQGRRDL
jgi:hypothetical protein